VLRLRYQNTAGQTVGTARLLGTTIGDIEVRPSQRRKGYGQAILRDLIEHGGRALIAVTGESRRLAEREGFIHSATSGFHVLPPIALAGPNRCSPSRRLVPACFVLNQFDSTSPSSDLYYLNALD
jgi:hypothetical protein